MISSPEELTTGLFGVSVNGKDKGSGGAFPNDFLNYINKTPNPNTSKPFIQRQCRLGLLRMFYVKQCYIGMRKSCKLSNDTFGFHVC